MRIGKTVFDFEKEKYIMGILNVTPDSFSDGGRFNTVDKAIAQVEKMISDGVDIIDVGGESTRPGSTPVSAEEERRRVIPVIERIRRFSDIPISIDTFKTETLKAARDAGADCANDVWSGLKDESMLRTVAQMQLPMILMHNRDNMDYQDFVSDWLCDMKNRVQAALDAGIAADRIILDPGIGFAKDYAHNLAALRHLDQLVALGYPVLLATSRKRFIGHATGVTQADQRVHGTVATTVYGAMKGAVMFRVHDVAENKQALKMTCAMMEDRNDGLLSR